MSEKAQTPIRVENSLRELQVMQELSISSERTLYGWAPGCPYLDGDPFPSEEASVHVQQRNQWGTFTRAYSVKTWPRSLVELVKDKQAEVKDGHWIGGQGDAWLSEGRTREKIVTAKSDFHCCKLIEWPDLDAKPAELPRSPSRCQSAAAAAGEELKRRGVES